MNTPEKKEQSRLGKVSCVLALLPLITLGMILVWDNNPGLQPPPMVWIGFLFIGVGLSPIIGLLVGIAGLLQNTEPRVLPAIGTIGSIVWICLVVATIASFSLGGMPF